MPMASQAFDAAVLEMALSTRHTPTTNSGSGIIASINVTVEHKKV